MINQLAFKASYIGTAKIQRRENTGEKFTPYTTSFVKLDPYSSNDFETVRDVNLKWNYGKTFASYIYEHMDLEEHNPYYKDFYALTTQNKDFDKLYSKQILGLAQVRRTRMGIILEYLIARPDDNMHSKERNFKRIGTAIIECLKSIYNHKDISVESVDSAVEFYKANGFEVKKGNILQLKR